jgi:hypothetical protein
MDAARKCAKRYKEVVDKFHRPETETDIGELMAKVRRDPAAYQYLKQAVPAQVREMENRYGTD